MLEQEIVLGEHNSFERAATDEVHYTMKQYFEILYHLHIVYVTLHRGCPFSQTESVWWLKREAAKSTWWVHSDPNLYDARTQMNWMNWFWNKRFLPPVQASQGMYLLTWDSGLRKLSPEHSHSSKALSKFFVFFFFFGGPSSSPQWMSKRPPLCAASLWDSITLTCPGTAPHGALCAQMQVQGTRKRDSALKTKTNVTAKRVWAWYISR